MGTPHDTKEGGSESPLVLELCSLHSTGYYVTLRPITAAVAELADALDSGSSGSKIPWRFDSSQPHFNPPTDGLKTVRGNRFLSSIRPVDQPSPAFPPGHPHHP